MFRSVLIGLVAGQRAMTPLAVLAVAARRGDLPEGTPARDFLAQPAVAFGAAVLAAGEMAGDKLPSAPDRIILPGLLARSLTAAFAGALLAPPDRRAEGSAIAAAAALGSSYVGFHLRVLAMRRFGQTPTGLVEDAIVLGSGLAIARQRG